jgi:hypothetical protein
MKFLTFFMPAGNNSEPPSPDHQKRMGAYAEESKKNGKLVETGYLLPGVPVMKVKRTGDKFAVSDAPALTQGKGYAIINAASREEALAFTKEFLGLAGDGENEIFQLMG